MDKQSSCESNAGRGVAFRSRGLAPSRLLRTGRISSVAFAIFLCCAAVLLGPFAGPAFGQVRTGTYVGNNVDGRSFSGLGFTPSFVIIKGHNKEAVAKTGEMPFDRSKPMIAANPLQADHIQSLDSEGFTIGKSDWVNRGGVSYWWAAFKSVDGSVATGSYVGTRTDNRVIDISSTSSSTDFQPDYVIILGDEAKRATHRTSSVSGDKTLFFSSDNPKANLIQNLSLPNGFEIGSDDDVNKIGATYYYVAFKNIAGRINVGSYVGNGTDNSNVLGFGFKPEYVIIKDSTNKDSVARAGALLGDQSLPFAAFNNVDNAIQALLADGIEVGTRDWVNQAGLTYYWSAFAGLPMVDLEITKTVDKALPSVGDTLIYTITLSNKSSNDGYDIVVTDLLPPQVTYVSDTPSRGTYDELSGLWTVGDLLNGASGTLTIEASVNPGTGGITIVNTATITSTANADSIMSNDSHSVSCTVSGADLEVSKSVDDSSADEGTTVNFTVTLTNHGPNNASGIELTDLLPSGLTYVSDSPSQGSYVAGTGVWTVGVLNAGVAATLNLTATIDPGTNGTAITNTVTITASSEADGNVGNNTDSAIIKVGASDLRLTKLVDQVLPTEGDTLQYTITVINAGPNDVTGVEVTDLPPVGISSVSNLATIGTYNAGSGVWTIGSLANGASAVLELVGRIDVGTGGSLITNSASVTGMDQDDLDPANNDDSAVITVATADLSISKVVNDATPDENDLITYSIVVINLGPDTATNTEATDILPLGVTFAAATASRGSYDAGSGLWTIGSLAAGTSASLVISVNVDSGTADSLISNVASATAHQTDPVSGNNSDSVDITVTSADLALGKSVDDPIPNEGDTITYTIALTNNGPDAATGVQVTDVLPSGVTHVSHTGSQGNYDIGSGLWTVGSLANGASVTLDITASVNAGTNGSTITNSTNVSASDQADALLGNNVATAGITVQSADLIVTKVVDVELPNEGDSIVYTVTLTNAGPNDATNVVIMDLLPAGVTYISNTPGQGSYDSTTGVWSIGTIQADSTTTLTITANVDSGANGSTISNTASVASVDQADPVAANNTDGVDITVQSIDLVLTKEVDNANPSEGATIAYTVTLSNSGPSDATNVLVGDALPAGLTYVSSTPSQGSYDSGAGIWTAGTLASSASASLTIMATVDTGSAGSTITNTASVVSVDQTDPVPANNSDSVDINAQAVDLEVSKSADLVSPNEGDAVVYTIDITNNGPSAATGVTLTDMLPAGLTLENTTTSQGSYNSTTGLWTVGAIGNGGNATLVLNVRVDSGTNSTTISNTAALTAVNQVDITPANDSATVDITVQGADLVVTKVVDDAMPNEGDTIIYTVTLANAGPNDATNVSVTDVLPSGVTYLSDATSQGTYDSGTGEWTIGTVTSGGNATLDLIVSVDAGTQASTIRNTASVTAADQADPTPANASDDANITVQGADITLTKLVNDSTPDEGDLITYSIVITNGGPNAATNVQVADLLPPGVTYVGSSPGVGSYNAVTGVWTVGTIAKGSAATLVIAASPDAGTAGATITNTATVSAMDQADANVANNTDSVDITVTSVDLALAKVVNNPTPTEGDTITYTLTMANNGPDDASGVRVTDILSAGLTYVAHAGSQGSYNVASGVWNVGALANGASANLSLAARVNLGTNGSTISNVATITDADQADPNLVDNSDTADVTVQSADLQVTKLVDNGTPNEGDTITYTITVVNNGPSTATNTQVTDPLPNGVTYISDTSSQGTYNSNTGLWDLGTINSGANATLVLVASVDAGTNGSTISNTASVAAVNQGDPIPGNETAGADITVQRADLRLSKVVNEPTPTEGDTLIYTVALVNDGPDNATNVEVTDMLPAGVTLVSSTASQGNYDNGTGVWATGALAVGASASLTLEATVDVGTGGLVITNTAAVTAVDQADPNQANNSSSADIGSQAADLSISKNVDVPAPNEGATITYTVTLNNSGPSAASNVVVVDSLPLGVTYISDSPSRGSYDSNTGTWNVGDLQSGASATLQLVVSVDAGTNGSIIANTATVASMDQADPNGANDNDVATIAVQGADLQVTKLVDNEMPNEGDAIAFTIRVANAGPNDATNVVVNDVLPAGLTHFSNVPSQGAYDVGSGAWNVGGVANGSDATLVVTATVDAGTNGQTIVNMASVAAVDQADPAGTNNVDSVAVTVQRADLAIATLVDDPTPNENDSIAYTVTVTNNGPDMATNVGVLDVLPADVTFVSATATLGSYDDTTAVWTVGAIGSGANEVLNLVATVNPGTNGSTVSNTATISTVDQGDPNLSNNSSAIQFTVQSSDLALSKSVDNAAPNETETIVYTLTLTNNGPENAANIEVSDVLPAGVTFVSSSADAGAYDSNTGIWAVASLPNTATANLEITATVDAGTGGTRITNTANILRSDQGDPDSSNNSASVEIGALSADLVVLNTPDNSIVREGATVRFTISVTNNGPSDATGVQVTNVLPTNLRFISALPSTGTYSPSSGIWNVGNVGKDASEALVLTATVEPGSGGTVITSTAAVSASDQSDPNTDNNSDDAQVTVLPPGLTLTVAAPVSHPLRPGDPHEEIYRIRLSNATAVAETLVSMTLTNTSNGPGSVSQLDASWSMLTLFVDDGDSLTTPVVSGPLANTVGSFSGDTVSFGGLRVEVAPGESTELVLYGGASLVARDGDRLGVTVSAATDVAFTRDLSVSGVWPLTPFAVFVVDGMTAAQIVQHAVGPETFLAGSVDNVTLDFVVPANGYESDTIDKLNVVNLGNARPVQDIAAVKAWADDGDGLFNAAVDTNLGTFLYTGTRWELTGVGTPVPRTGQRTFVTVDIAESGTEGRTLRLALPSWPDVAIGNASGNDGPIDATVANPHVQAISTVDRVTLTVAPMEGVVVTPGSSKLLVLDLIATNSFSVTKSLTALTLRDRTTSLGSATPADLDRVVAQLLLRLDANDDGLLSDIATDPVVGSASFVDGAAVFSGLLWNLPASSTRHLFVTADISLLRAADGDVVAVEISNPGDVSFADGTTLAASWPLDSGARLQINGMIKKQITRFDIVPATLAPNDGPHLAFDCLIPPNGHYDDVLEGLQIVNLGTATEADLSELRLWRDGGDGLFNGGVGDDLDLGPFVWFGDRWKSPVTNETIPRTGARLFVVLTVAGTLADSSTVALGIPAYGVTVASENDGPIDGVLANSASLLLSGAPLLTNVSIEPRVSTIGQDVTVRMIVRNVGGETITDVTPTALLGRGAGTLALVDGPTPSVLTLASGASASFEWTYQASSVGDVYLRGQASGTGSSSSLIRTSLLTDSNEHRIFIPAEELNVYPAGNMPLAISRGQVGVTPLILTLSNDGGALGSSVRLRGLRIRLEDEQGTGIIPADLLSRVTVSEGTDTYLVRSSLETSGSEVDLQLAAPVLITGLEPVTVSIKLDISPTTLVPAFRVAIVTDTWFQAEDATSGAPLAVNLLYGNYPILSGLARLVAESKQLDVSETSRATHYVGVGQGDVDIMAIKLENSGIDTLSSAARVDGFSITLTDTSAVTLQDPRKFLRAIRLVGPLQIHASHAITSNDSSAIAFTLSTPLQVPVNTAVTLRIVADILDSAPQDAFTPQLLDPSGFRVRDANTGVVIPAVYTTSPIRGSSIVLQSPATTLVVSGRSEFPATIMIGEADIVALTAVLTHPGLPGTARIAAEQITVQFRNERRALLFPGVYIDRLRVLWNGLQVAASTDLPVNKTDLNLTLTGVSLGAGEVGELTVVIDTEASAPAGFIELSLEGTDIHASDSNTGSPVSVTPATSGALPVLSGIARLQAPAEDLLVGLTSLMPPVLVPGSSAIAAAKLTLSNPSDVSAGDVLVDSLWVRAANGAFADLPIGQAIVEIEAYLGAQLWASSGVIDASQVRAPLTGDEPLVIRPGNTSSLDLKITLRDNAQGEPLRIGCDTEDVGIVQPEGLVRAVSVRAVAGQQFPLWTEAGNFVSRSLQESYGNFPNPFAAGREHTTFVFYLPESGSVDLQILTARGEPVRTILKSQRKTRGLHQVDTWDGKNGRGVTVMNGVYLAELVFKSDGGRQAKVWRKVAVVR